MGDVPLQMRRLSDEQWLDLLIRSVDSPVIDGFQFPGFPEDAFQTRFVGSANEKTLREAFEFYRFLKHSANRHGSPVGPNSRVLDFGCGWGRYLRFFMKDVEAKNLYGCDVDGQALQVCKDTGIPGQLSKIDPLGTLPYPDGYFDVMMAYSIFTHLPEKVHVHWLKELSRVAAPGCVFCLTLEPRRFIDFVASIPDDSPSDWYRWLARFKPQVEAFRRDFDAGQVVFMGTNANIEEIYGDAVVPLSFVNRVWAPHFEIKQYLDDAARFWQAVLVARKPGGTRSGLLARLLGFLDK